MNIDDVLGTMDVNVSFNNLDGNSTASHIHCCTAVAGTGAIGVATELPSFTGFPLGVKSGTYFHTFDLTDVNTFNPSFVAANGGSAGGAAAALLQGMFDDKAYLNVHSEAFPGGEIRGFLHPVPEPTTLLLLGGGLSAAALRARRRRG